MRVKGERPPLREVHGMWRADPPLTTNPWRFLFFAARPYRSLALLSFLAVSAAAILNALTAYVYKLIINSAVHFSTEGIAPLWWAIGWYIFVSITSSLAWRASGFTAMRWTTGVRATARYALTSYVIRHNYEYFSSRFAGSISSKISSAANSIKDIGEKLLWQFTGFTATMLTSFAIVYTSSHFIAYLFVVWVILITPMNLYFARRRAGYSTVAQAAETTLSGATVDMLTNMPAVQEYTGHAFELTRLRAFIVNRRNLGYRNWRFGEWVLLLNGLLQDIFVAAMMLYSVYSVAQGTASPGDIALILTAVLIVEDRLTFIGNQINDFADSWGQVVEGLKDILQPHEIMDKVGAEELIVKEALIAFDHVSFNYGGNNVFDDLTLTIPAGEKVGLVGRSGAGKTTLTRLLLRHYEATSGTVRIGQQSVLGVTIESLRKAIAVVPQEPLLFHRSIRDNIAYGRPSASEAEIVRAAQMAQAHDFIMALLNGYDALVGERGVKLSGGQRQRIAIARVMLKNAPILLLDEATSSLDSENEVAVQKALLALMEGRTVIAVAHRLSTLRAMDRIIVMDGGKIIEDGTHDELLQRGGVYSELWAHQAGGFLEA